MNQVRCNGCREWFDGFYRECPGCGHERPRFNSWLKASMLNNALLQEAARVEASK